jgi:hypothetical protein
MKPDYTLNLSEIHGFGEVTARMLRSESLQHTDDKGVSASTQKPLSPVADRIFIAGSTRFWSFVKNDTLKGYVAVDESDLLIPRISRAICLCEKEVTYTSCSKTGTR